MTAEKKKEFEKEFTEQNGWMKQGLQSNCVCQWIDDLVDEACKRQREICSSLIGTNWLDAVYSEYLKDNDTEKLLRKLKVLILNAPTPEGDK